MNSNSIKDIANAVSSYYNRKPTWRERYLPDNRSAGEKLRDNVAIAGPSAVAEVVVGRVADKALDITFAIPSKVAAGAWVIGNVVTFGYLAKGVGRARTFLANCEAAAMGKSDADRAADLLAGLKTEEISTVIDAVEERQRRAKVEAAAAKVNAPPPAATGTDGK